MSIGCLMLDLEGTTLNADEIEMINHPLTGGIIFFSRNFECQIQIQELCRRIRRIADKPLLIAVDHEGGRVQRFYEKFSDIPAMGLFQHLDASESDILEKLSTTAWLMAAELMSSGIDISFAPVLDVDIGLSKVIGDRGFSNNPEKIINYSTAFIQGMNKAGMSATGKHFPGHGSTIADSHFELPVDNRTMEQIRDLDLSVFSAVIKSGLSAVMPAHVIYSEVDPIPACFSPYWLQSILREELQFTGTVFSDDLSMEGAKSMGDITSRAQQALAAGCDMILCCNDLSATVALLDSLPQKKDREKLARIQSMKMTKQSATFSEIQKTPNWKEAKSILNQLEQIT